MQSPFTFHGTFSFSTFDGTRRVHGPRAWSSSARVPRRRLSCAGLRGSSRPAVSFEFENAEPVPLRSRRACCCSGRERPWCFGAACGRGRDTDRIVACPRPFRTSRSRRVRRTPSGSSGCRRSSPPRSRPSPRTASTSRRSPCWRRREDRLPAARDLAALLRRVERDARRRVPGTPRADGGARKHRHRRAARSHGRSVRAVARTAVLAACVLSAAGAPQPASIPPGAERAYLALKDRVDGNAAMDVVRFMDQYWRIAGNPGFNASVDRIRDGLQKAGLAPRVEEFARARTRLGLPGRHGGVRRHRRGAAVARDGPRVALHQLVLDAAGAIEAPLVDVGAGAPADFAGKDVKGAVVLGSAPVRQLWQQAVKARGAAGVISTSIAPYIRPDGSGAVHVSRSAGRVPVGQRALRRGGEGVRLQGELARRREDARAA